MYISFNSKWDTGFDKRKYPWSKNTAIYGEVTTKNTVIRNHRPGSFSFLFVAGSSTRHFFVLHIMTYALTNQLIIEHMSTAYFKKDHGIIIVLFKKWEKFHWTKFNSFIHQLILQKIWNLNWWMVFIILCR